MNTARHRIRRAHLIYVPFFLLLGGGLLFWWRYETEPRAVNLQVDQDFPAGMTYRTFEWRDPARNTTTEFHVVIVPVDQVRTDIWFQDSGTAAQDAVTLAEVAKKSDAFLVVNGGFFTHDFKPAGLAVSDGVRQEPPSNAPVQSGFVTVSMEGMIGLHKRDNGVPSGQDAIQAGPFLIDPGGKLGIYTDDDRSQRRSIIALSSDGRLVLITADAMSLYQLALLLDDRADLFGVSSFDRALNLDGGPSAGLYIGHYTPGLVTQPQGPIHNFLVFHAR